MAVRAKFYVQSIKRVEGSSTADQVTLGAVCRGVENAVWSQATPAGTIQLSVLNEDATAQFAEGEEYYVTFEHADKPRPGDGHAPVPIRNKWGAWLCETCGGFPSYDTRAHPEWAKVPAEALDWSVHRQVYEG